MNVGARARLWKTITMSWGFNKCPRQFCCVLKQSVSWITCIYGLARCGRGRAGIDGRLRSSPSRRAWRYRNHSAANMSQHWPSRASLFGNSGPVGHVRVKIRIIFHYHDAYGTMKFNLCGFLLVSLFFCLFSLCLLGVNFNSKSQLIILTGETFLVLL